MYNNVFFIHGAWASRHAFNYISSKINTLGQIQYFEYDCQVEKPCDILTRAKKEIRELNRNGKNTTIVGHSLGGILGTYLHQHASNVVTLAAPLAGIDGLNFMMHTFLIIYAPVFRHIMPKSKFITEMHNRNFGNTEFDICVANCGHNIAMRKPSDGTISIDSQTLWTPPNARVHMIESSHHEIIQHPHTISIIKQAI